MKKDVITIGSATQDVFLVSKGFKIIKSKLFKSGYGECFPYGSKVELEEIYTDTGGGATNASVTFANLGLKTAVISKVGQDLAGQNIILTLKKNKIDISKIKIIKDKRTAYSTILLVSGGDRTILVYRGVSANFTINDFNTKNLNSKWLYISSLNGNLNLITKIVQDANRKKIKIAINPGSRELQHGFAKLKKSLPEIEVFNLNREEALKLTKSKKDTSIKSLFKKLEKINSKIYVITDGIKGAYLYNKEKIYFAPSLGTIPLNTTGAGDAFGSGLVAGLIIKNNLEYALKMAVLNADGVIREMGAKHGLLTKKPNYRLLKKVKIKSSNY